MKAQIIFYDLKKLTQKTRTKATEELYGKTKTSHQGKYSHTLKPKLQKFIRPVRATIIVHNNDVHIIKKLFTSYGIKHRACQIQIKSTDFKNTQFF